MLRSILSPYGYISFNTHSSPKTNNCILISPSPSNIMLLCLSDAHKPLTPSHVILHPFIYTVRLHWLSALLSRCTLSRGSSVYLMQIFPFFLQTLSHQVASQPGYAKSLLQCCSNTTSVLFALQSFRCHIPFFSNLISSLSH